MLVLVQPLVRVSLEGTTRTLLALEPSPAFALTVRLELYAHALQPSPLCVSHCVPAVCSVCSGDEHPLSVCSASSDTVCEPLPLVCVEEGYCVGLGLIDIPTGIWENVTSLNMTGNAMFGVDSRALARLPNLVPELT